MSLGQEPCLRLPADTKKVFSFGEFRKHREGGLFGKAEESEC
jgi:hypothetical protein